MNRMSGLCCNRRYVYEGDEQTGQDSFTYHVTIYRHILTRGMLSRARSLKFLIPATQNLASALYVEHTSVVRNSATRNERSVDDTLTTFK